MSSQQATLGSILRGLRSRQNWTLKEMSQKSGIPVSTLSKIEHDRLTLTYDKLQQMSERLNIRISDLFAEGEAASTAVVGRRSIGTLERSLHINTDNYDHFYLCTELRQKRMIPCITKVRAKSIEEFGALIRHSGEEYIYVVEGQVILHTEFYEPLTLNAGESVYIDSGMGHAYLAGNNCTEAVTVGVMSSAEDDLAKSLINAHADTKK